MMHASYRTPLMRGRSMNGPMLPTTSPGSRDSPYGVRKSRRSGGWKGTCGRVLMYSVLLGLVFGAGYAIVGVTGKRSNKRAAQAVTKQSLDDADDGGRWRDDLREQERLRHEQEAAARHGMDSHPEDIHHDDAHYHGGHDTHYTHDDHDAALHDARYHHEEHDVHDLHDLHHDVHEAAAAHEQHGAGQQGQQQQQQQQKVEQKRVEQHSPPPPPPSVVATGGVGVAVPSPVLPRATTDEELGIYDMGFTATEIKGRQLNLADYHGRVVLFVNVASQCGFTEANYKALQAVYERYHGYGFDVIAAPCNDFGHQEPWENSKIESYARTTFNVTFPLLAKVEAINSHPIFTWLRAHSPAAPGGGKPDAEINWNFNKFLVDKWGHVVRRYGSEVKQGEFEQDVYDELMKPMDLPRPGSKGQVAH